MNEKYKKLNLSLIIAIAAMIVYDVCLIILNINVISNANDQLKHLKQQFLVGSEATKLEQLILNQQIAKWFIVATLILFVIALIITIVNRAKAKKSLQLIIIGLLAIVAVLFIVGIGVGTPPLALVSLLLLIPAYRGYKELNSSQPVVQQVYAQQ